MFSTFLCIQLGLWISRDTSFTTGFVTFFPHERKRSLLSSTLTEKKSFFRVRFSYIFTKYLLPLSHIIDIAIWEKNKRNRPAIGNSVTTIARKHTVLHMNRQRRISFITQTRRSPETQSPRVEPAQCNSSLVTHALFALGADLRCYNTSTALSGQMA